jgi:hypothetical protein
MISKLRSAVMLLFSSIVVFCFDDSRIFVHFSLAPSPSSCRKVGQDAFHPDFDAKIKKFIL